MKKLKINFSKNILTKEQMKSIVGASGDCVVTCPDGHKLTCHYESGHCAIATNEESCYSYDNGTIAFQTC